MKKLVFYEKKKRSKEMKEYEELALAEGPAPARAAYLVKRRGVLLPEHPILIPRFHEAQLEE